MTTWQEYNTEIGEKTPWISRKKGKDGAYYYQCSICGIVMSDNLKHDCREDTNSITQG